MAMPADEQARPDPIILGAALRYASRGLRVIPIHPGTKRPVGDDWPERASNDADVIRRWWKQNPAYGVGIATGWYGDRCIFVIDVDDGVDVKTGRVKEGSETLADLEAVHGPLPDTVEGQSGGGGRHLFFWASVEIHNDQAGLLGVDLDLRGVGGQVVAEPTVHPDTHRPYVWIDGHDPIVGKIAQAPAWLVELLTSAPTAEPRAERVPYEGAPRPGDRFAAAVTWPEILRRDGAAFLGVRQDRKTGHPYEIWARPGADHTSATLYYGGTDVLKVFTSNWAALTQEKTYTRFGYFTATRYGGDHSKAAAALAKAQFEDDIRRLVADTPSKAEPADDSTEETDDDVSPQSRLRQNLRFGAEILNLPPVTWLVNGIIQADGIGAIYGKPKSFKSFIAIDLSLHVSNGRPWRGINVEPTRVLYIAAEGAPGVGPRAEAWCYEHAGTLDNIVWLTVAPDLFTRNDGHDEVAELADIAAGYDCGLVFVDTLARSIPGAEENSAKDLGTVVSHLDHIRTEAGCSVVVVHHAGKDAGRGMRGSSALHGAIDTGLAVEGDQQAVNMQLVDQKNAESGLSWWWKPTKLLSSIVLTASAGPDASEVGVRDLNLLKQLQNIDSGSGVSQSEWKQSVLERGLCGETLFKERVKALHEEGFVERVGASQRAPWRLTANGRQRLNEMT